MPTGVYKRKKGIHPCVPHTEEHKRKLKIARQRIPSRNKGMHWKIKDTSKMKKPKSERHKSNMRQPKTEEHKKKIRKASIKRWQNLEYRKKQSERMKGDRNPAKRLEVRKTISESLKNRKLSEETKRKISKNSGSRRPDVRKKIREWQIAHPNRKFKDTSIELKIEKELQRRKIHYQKQVSLCKVAIVDFYLPDNKTVIQCDGDYYHTLPGAQEKDERQDRVLTFNGFDVYRFWEHEINKSPKKCVDKLKE